jgi:hypothetical protein
MKQSDHPKAADYSQVFKLVNKCINSSARETYSMPIDNNEIYSEYLAGIDAKGVEHLSSLYVDTSYIIQQYHKLKTLCNGTATYVLSARNINKVFNLLISLSALNAKPPFEQRIEIPTTIITAGFFLRSILLVVEYKIESRRNSGAQYQDLPEIKCHFVNSKAIIIDSELLDEVFVSIEKGLDSIKRHIGMLPLVN